MKTTTLIISIFLVTLFSRCTPAVVHADMVITDSIINPSYIGNGAQWDPYQLNFGKGDLTFSEADWQKIYARLDTMRPQLMRVMINAAGLERNGEFDGVSSFPSIQRILEYCQTRNVNVMLGDWGWGQVDPKAKTINKKAIGYAAANLNFLVNEKGFTCIKYFNLINEPNGYWSSTEGDYRLWAQAIRYFHGEIGKLNLNGKVSIVGPDAAIWGPKEAWWVDSCATQLGNQIGLYDIHTYPSKITVNSGEYGKIIRAYKSKVPANSQMVLGEIGFKFVEKADSAYANENDKRIAAKAHASKGDSQMFVYDYMYGTDMADALFQTVNEGLSGCVVWMLDDAMHSNEAPDKLKIWGFWNIFGDEQFGAEEEQVRPWYYAWSMLSRYMPTGSKVYKVINNEKTGVRAIAVEKDGKRMVAFVNTQGVDKQLIVESDGWGKLSGVKQFVYNSTSVIKVGDCGFKPNQSSLTIDLSKGLQVNVPAESLIVYTNME